MDDFDGVDRLLSVYGVLDPLTRDDLSDSSYP